MQIEPSSSAIVRDSVAAYFEQVREAISRLDLGQISKTVQVLLDANRRGATIFIFGNGGSAATASHFVNDLAKGCTVEGHPRFRAISLNDNVALMTAWANDTSYENIFAAQLSNLVRSGDVVLGISGSGNSPNVLNAIETGRAAGAYTMGWCGFGGGKLRGLVDLAITSDCNVMEQVEDLHLSIGHNIVRAIRTELSLVQASFAVALPENVHPVRPTVNA